MIFHTHCNWLSVWMLLSALSDLNQQTSAYMLDKDMQSSAITPSSLISVNFSTAQVLWSKFDMLTIHVAVIFLQEKSHNALNMLHVNSTTVMCDVLLCSLKSCCLCFMFWNTCLSSLFLNFHFMFLFLCLCSAVGEDSLHGFTESHVFQQYKDVVY